MIIQAHTFTVGSAYNYLLIMSQPAGQSHSSLNSPIDTQSCQYEIRTQSNFFPDDETADGAPHLEQHLAKDLTDRYTQVGENIAGRLFKDIDFGFPINDQFMENFYGAFTSSGGILNKEHFHTDKSTAVFLNRIISTIAQFLHATDQVPLKPLRYFTAIHSNKPLPGHPIKRKPDIMLIHLDNGCVQSGPFDWSDLLALIEHTREKRPPKRLPETITVKSYLAFCCQPKRDYLISLGITGEGFHIVLTDHAGHVETDVISFDRNVNTTVFIRMLMGFAFLPDSFLGIDTTITREKDLKQSPEDLKQPGILFAEKYPPFSSTNMNPSNPFLVYSAGLSVNDSLTVISTSPAVSPTVSYIPASPNSVNEQTTISVGGNIYRVIRLLFRSQSLIGRATKAFLVEFPDGRRGVLKDSWITTNRDSEAKFLRGLHIPYGPDLVDHCTLGNTAGFRQFTIRSAVNSDCREKRRIVTYPAGVHISDFTCMLELMFAFFDIVLCMWHFFNPFALPHFLTLGYCSDSHIVLGD